MPVSLSMLFCGGIVVACAMAMPLVFLAKFLLAIQSFSNDFEWLDFYPAIEENSELFPLWLICWFISQLVCPVISIVIIFNL